MKISVITASFNRKNTILRALKSVKNQNYKNIELIVIDGNSDDGSIELIKPFISNNDILVVENDSGIYDALNKGIKRSSGDIVAFLHSDDLYANTNVLSEINSAFLNNDLDIIYGNVGFFNSDPSYLKRIYKSDKLSRKNLSWGKMPAHPAMFLKKSIYDKHGLFDISYRIAADYEFLCRIINDPSLQSEYIDKIFVKMQTGGISTNGLKSKFILNKEVLKACKTNGIYTNLIMILSKYPSKIKQLFK